MKDLTITPENGEVTVLNKEVSSFQNNVEIDANGKVTGDLSYVEGWTDFSGDPALQNGYYVCVHWANPDASATSLKINGYEALGDPDQNHVQRLNANDVRKNKIKFVQADAAGHENIQWLDLTGLTLLPADDNLGA